MKILVDTSVWSAALRRSPEPATAHQHQVVRKLRELIDEVRVAIIGPIRQELLSGIRDPSQFHLLREKLSAFPDSPLETADYERAAEFFNTARGKGIQGSHIDFLICAAAERRGFAIFTVDQDFSHYQSVLPIEILPIK